ncbi:class I SAM-dependent methyltransferase [Aeoliella sp. SH292]|uniref:class I SAM-dependent methyltransferase n=1 Tax=Aeoliella sp. SH292 TaxID=3454464 RepID=UPI003F9C5FDF
MTRFAYAVLVVIAFSSSTVFAQPATVELPADINKNFLDPELNPEEWTEKFEQDGREAYEARNFILEAVGIQSGMRVADVGAGTGLFTVLFSEAVGDQGWVYAVDIAPNFIEHIAQRAKEAGIANITPVLCSDQSINLPPESIDIAYVCDTYHHFEHPTATVASIYKALKPGGKLIVVDFVREEGISSDWILGHVRAGKEVFKAEIISTGMEFVAEPKIETMEENYLLVFRKPLTGK